MGRWLIGALCLSGCGGGGSPYAWDSFGYGSSDGGCEATVGLTEGPAESIDIFCTDGECDCQIDGTSAVIFEDPTLCEEWEKAFDGSARKQDRMVAYAVEQCQLEAASE